MLGAPVLASRDVVGLTARGQQLLTEGRTREAFEIALSLSAVTPGCPEAHAAVGVLFVHCDDAARAQPHFARAVSLAPDELRFLYYLAITQRMTGNLVAAEDSLDRVLAGRRSTFGAYYVRADLRTQTAERNHVGEMVGLLQSLPSGHRGGLPLCFAIAKELEDLEDYDSSFAYLQRGCSLKRRTLAYDLEGDIATMRAIAARHSREAVTAPKSACESDECIFILGLPRSGTTLVDRIVSSHSHVFSAGELTSFATELAQHVRKHTGRSNPSELEVVGASMQVDARALGRAYLAATRPRTGHTARFTNKWPLNYLYAGALRRALPNARLLSLTRHPMDVCYAMYRTLFTDWYGFSYDLSELGRYYVAWRELMAHWASVLSVELLSIAYEDLVVDPETVSRRMLAHCGLPWEDACLSFHERADAVSTASSAQVRRPVYRSSVGKWRNYARHLAPLADLLSSQGVPFS
jgi:tetratricopeptide (TPR) repeat protein